MATGRVRGGMPTASELRDAFAKFDVNGDGDVKGDRPDLNVTEAKFDNDAHDDDGSAKFFSRCGTCSDEAEIFKRKIG